MDSNCVAIVSGGLDSTTLVYDLLEQGHTPYMLSFDYGQRHRKELDYACMTACKLNLEYYQVDLSSITALISNSALTSSAAVPEGHYAEDNMKQTVVPNRNMIMLSIAAGLAVSKDMDFIATGVHAGDHFVYPDCRPRFINAFAAAAIAGNQGFGKVPEWPENERLGTDQTNFVRVPYLYKSKADIAYRALELNVPLHETWSCYKGGEIHCGRCGTCVERLEAIAHAQQLYAVKRSLSEDQHPMDWTEYADTAYWKTAAK